MQGFGIDGDAVACLSCEYSRLTGLSSTVGLEVRKESVGFMVQVRVQAVIRLFTYLML